MDLNDCVSVSASQWEKCCHFPSKTGSGPSLHHPLGAESRTRWAPAAPQPFCLYPSVCCSSDGASCVCVGFAKFLSSVPSAENMLSPSPLCSSSRGPVVCTGVFLPRLLGPLLSPFLSRGRGRLCLFVKEMITPESPSLGPLLASNQVPAQKSFPGKRQMESVFSLSTQCPSLNQPVSRIRSFLGSDGTYRDKEYQRCHWWLRKGPGR